jgi:hypothetical protein
MKVFFMSLILLVISSCASHSTMRGSVVMKMGPDSAHVCLGDNEVKAGDRVVAYKHNCSQGAVGHPNHNLSNVENTSCVREKLGSGTVVKTLNDHYSEVKFDSGVLFGEGTTVEKE